MFTVKVPVYFLNGRYAFRSRLGEIHTFTYADFHPLTVPVVHQGEEFGCVVSFHNGDYFEFVPLKTDHVAGEYMKLTHILMDCYDEDQEEECLKPITKSQIL